MTEGQKVARQMKGMVDTGYKRPWPGKLRIDPAWLTHWADRLEREATGGPTDSEMDMGREDRTGDRTISDLRKAAKIPEGPEDLSPNGGWFPGETYRPDRPGTSAAEQAWKRRLIEFIEKHG